MKGDVTQKVIHVVLTPRDHEFLVKNLKTDGDTLAYRSFLQTINLLVYLASMGSIDVVVKRLKDLLVNKVSGLVIKRNLSDSTNIEPYHIWMSVLSPEERGLLMKKVNENFFNTQSKLLRVYRSGNPGTSGKDLEVLKQRVDSSLSQGVKATIYGRLKVYRDVQKQPEVRQLISSRKGTKQLTDAELRRYAKDQGALSLFVEENIVATVNNVVIKPVEIMDLTRKAYLHPTTDKIFYYMEDIESTITYKSLLDKEIASKLSEGERNFLLSIRSRAIHFVPGSSRRY